jgi:hypothetical protein
MGGRQLRVKNEKELAKMRLALDPNDPNKVVKIDSLHEQPEETGQGIPRSAKSHPSKNNCNKDFASNGNRGDGVSVRPGGDGENNPPAQVSDMPNAQSEVIEASTDPETSEVISVADPTVPLEEPAQEQPGITEKSSPNSTGNGDRGDGDSVPPGGNGGNDHRLRDLFKGAAAKLGQANSLEKRGMGLLRKSTEEILAGGLMLLEAQTILKNDKKWCAGLKANGIPRSTAWEAVKLAERAKTPEAIAGLTPNEAKIQFGIYPPKRGAENAGAAQIRNDNHEGNTDGHESTKAAAESTDNPDTELNADNPSRKPFDEPPPPITDNEQRAFETFIAAVGDPDRAEYVFQEGLKMLRELQDEEK